MRPEFGSVELDHVQLAAPPNCEEAAREFYGGILGFDELSKPEQLAGRGGVWFRCGTKQVHVGVQEDFVPATKAHPAFRVGSLEALREHLISCGVAVAEGEPMEEMVHLYVQDPFGNRLEFLERR